MRFLDTREQKSPRFLVDAFPDIEIKPLAVGDYFSGESKCKSTTCPNNWGCYALNWDDKLSKENCTAYELGLEGNLVEIKFEKDWGKHTEPLERIQDEFYRMVIYKEKNPHVNLHAVWICASPTFSEIKHFFSLCFQYDIWGHIVNDAGELVQFLKALDQPSQYKKHAPYIKRSHEEPTILAKMLRQFPGISSEKAILIAESYNSLIALTYVPNKLYDIIGWKKNGAPRKLGIDLFTWLETGAEP